MRRRAARKADVPYRDREEFAMGIARLELRDNKAKAFRQCPSMWQARTMPVHRANDEIDDHTSTRDINKHCYVQGSNPIDLEEWRRGGYRTRRLVGRWADELRMGRLEFH